MQLQSLIFTFLFVSTFGYPNGLVTCNLFVTLEPQNIWIRILQISVLISLLILWQTIWGALEKNTRLGFRKDCENPERFVLLLIKQKNHNKRFGEFEFEYFGGSDGSNKLMYFVPTPNFMNPKFQHPQFNVLQSAFFLI